MILVDRFCRLVRRYPLAVIALAPAGIVGLVFCWPQFFAARHAVATFARMWPPHLSPADLHELPALILQTLGMAAGGTLFAAILGLLVSPAAAQGIAPGIIVQLTRRVLEVARAIPEIVWGLLFVTFVGIGPWAGVAALGLHSFGVLGKLFAESLENVPPDPIRALRARALRGSRSPPSVTSRWLQVPSWFTVCFALSGTSVQPQCLESSAPVGLDRRCTMPSSFSFTRKCWRTCCYVRDGRRVRYCRHAITQALPRLLGSDRMTARENSNAQRSTVFLTNRVFPEVIGVSGRVCARGCQSVRRTILACGVCRKASGRHRPDVFNERSLDAKTLDQCPKLAHRGRGAEGL